MLCEKDSGDQEAHRILKLPVSCCSVGANVVLTQVGVPVTKGFPAR